SLELSASSLVSLYFFRRAVCRNQEKRGSGLLSLDPNRPRNNLAPDSVLENESTTSSWNRHLKKIEVPHDIVSFSDASLFSAGNSRQRQIRRHRYFSSESFSWLDPDRMGRGVYLGDRFRAANLCALCACERRVLLFAMRYAGTRWCAFLRRLRQICLGAGFLPAAPPHRFRKMFE